MSMFLASIAALSSGMMSGSGVWDGGRSCFTRAIWPYLMKIIMDSVSDIINLVDDAYCILKTRSVMGVTNTLKALVWITQVSLMYRLTSPNRVLYR